MRVLVIAHDIERGGAFRSLKNNVVGLSFIDGVELIVCTVKMGKLNKLCEDLGIENYVTGHGAFMVGGGSTKVRHIIRVLTLPYLRLRYLYRNHKAYKRITAYVDFKKVDIIYSNLNRNDIGAIISRRYDIPHVWYIREYGELDFQCISLRKNYIDYMKQGADLFIANSRAVADYWVTKGLPRKQMMHIYNGIETNIPIKPKSPDHNKTINIIQIGAIHPNKGQGELIEAVGLLPDEIKQMIKVDLYGTGAGEYIRKLKKFIHQMEMDRIFHFKGYQADIAENLQEYDIGIMASRAEAFGLVTVEEMLGGLAVIGSNTGATPEIIIDGECGLIYEQGCPKDLCSKLQMLIENEDYRRRLGRSARERVLEFFNKEQTVYYLYNTLAKNV